MAISPQLPRQRLRNEIARFGVLKLPIPAISNPSASGKQTPDQSLRGLFTDDFIKCSRLAISRGSSDFAPGDHFVSECRKPSPPLSEPPHHQ